jgi:hypothetical protein
LKLFWCEITPIVEFSIMSILNSTPFMKLQEVWTSCFSTKLND